MSEKRTLPVVVVVHGIGDQRPFETLRHVANRIAGLEGKASTLTLGQLYPPGLGPEQLGQDGDYEALVAAGHAWCSLPHIEPGLAEVYWADIARRLGDGRLDQLRPWVESLMRRTEWRYGQDASLDRTVGRELRSDAPLKALRLMLRLHNRLGWMLRIPPLTAGRRTLDYLLSQYLGDVQLFAEFADIRALIISRFTQKLDAIVAAAEADPELDGVDIHVVGHSLGSVVSFYGLLQGLEEQSPWIDHVRSFTTLGSPIDKFLYFWPEIGRKQETRLNERVANLPRPKRPIRWTNVFDVKDPVGHKLDMARSDQLPWVRHYFDFPESRDLCIRRYGWFGAAHGDYWADQGLFDWMTSEAGLLPTPRDAVAARRTAPLWVEGIAAGLLAVIAVVSVGYLAYDLWATREPLLADPSNLLARAGLIAALVSGALSFSALATLLVGFARSRRGLTHNRPERPPEPRNAP